jgi:predicted O-methyltransferase YrrM
MRQAVKHVIKAVLPTPLLRAALKLRDLLHLSATARRAFDATKLRPLKAEEMHAIFGDGRQEVSWHTDHAAINKVFGDDDKSGGINPGDRRAVYYLIRALEPRSVLEIGTHIGASTLFIGRALAANGGAGKLITVDILDVNRADGPWKQASLTMPPRHLAKAVGCEPVIEFVVSPSLAFMRATHQRFDFIFLDGDHSARAVYQEVAAALQVLNPGGTILLHDYYPGGKSLFPDDNVILGPYRAVSRISRECPELVVLPLGALPWPTKQGVNVTSLALVTHKTA